MKTYYLDSEFRLHLEQAENRIPWKDEHGFFSGKCKAFVEGFRVIPEGASWNGCNGLMITAAVDFSTLDKAQTEHGEMRAVMDKAGAMLDDAQASTVIDLYPAYPADGSLVTSGTRINWRYQLKRAAVDLWATDENNPDNAPALWEDINYRDGYRVIPETITAGTAFAKDELGWWEDTLYRSLLDANVWTPAAYPSGWEAVDV